MRRLNSIVSSVILSMALCGAAIAAPAVPAVPAKQAPVAIPAAVDCQKMGGDVSALIDAKLTSPNIAAARAAFQVGIMECMEGDDNAANKHYFEAKKLLGTDQPAAPAKPAAVALPAAAEADCQRVGGDVSALIDAKVASPNIAPARAAFQVGIMECMEGDDSAANKHYFEAKKLLTTEQPPTPVTAKK